MKKLLGILIVLLASYKAFACDQNLQAFSRDCAMQDRLASIRTKYSNLGIDLDEIGDYKGVRFIARGAWNGAMNMKKAPTDIYNPAPATWNVWEGGINSLFKNRQNKDALYNGSVTLDQNRFSQINLVLLTDGVTSIKDAGTAQNKKPGEFRHYNDTGVGYCAGAGDEEVYRKGIERAEDSMKTFQKKWESLSGVRFKDVVKQYNGLKWRRANLEPGMNISGACRDGTGVFIGYSSSYDVENQIDWIRIFIKTNLEAIQQGRGVLSPVALAAIVQKWFVSVHPFADGNGRTSRGVQDTIMANFGLPYVPGGDLQNDAMEDAEVYIENTYKQLDLMLAKLETCADNRALGLISRTCRTVEELNKNLIDDNQQLALEEQLKLKVQAPEAPLVNPNGGY
jgi:hypothetical protein